MIRNLIVFNMEYATLDKYKVIRTLGHGGFSDVKLVSDTNGEQYAAKIFKDLPPQMEERYRDSLNNEINNLKKLHHPNILTLIAYKENGIYTKKDQTQRFVTYLIMELCTKGSLFDFVFSNGFMEESTARYYFIDLISALETCHSAGICHRDIKPENILFNHNYDIKLSDFGFSITTEGRKGSGYLGSDIGTQGYMAPEILLHKPYRGAVTDIFSLGVVLFIMRSYNPPFIKASLNDPYYSVLINKENKFWEFCNKNKSIDHFSAPFRTLIKGMLAYDPDSRFTLDDIKQSVWFRGPAVHLPILSDQNSVEIAAYMTRQSADRVVGVDRTRFSGRMYRGFGYFRSSSIFNEDLKIKTITKEAFSALKYSYLFSFLDANQLLDALLIVLDNLRANYQNTKNSLGFAVSLDDLEFKISFYQYEEQVILLHLRKITGSEYKLNEIFLEISKAIKDLEVTLENEDSNKFQQVLEHTEEAE